MSSADTELPVKEAKETQMEKNAKKDGDVGEVNNRGAYDDDVEPLYPHGFRLAIIVASLATSVFLVALVG